MPKTTGNPKRWRPRFSLRTLVLFVTLVCLYFGAWEATKTFGVPAVSVFAESDGSDFHSQLLEATSPLPLYVRVRQFKNEIRSITPYRRQFVWIFGLIVHLRDEVEEEEPQMRIHGGVI